MNGTHLPTILEPGVQTAVDPGQPPAKQCWQDTGVYGDASCAELAKTVHCRNCAVFSQAAADVLSGPLPADYREGWARQFSLPKKNRELSTGSVILFRIGQEWLALATRCFQEVAEKRPIHSLPHQPPFILGLANVRGELVICMSLAHFLGFGQVPNLRMLRTSYHRLLVVSWSGCRLSFPADEVQGPHRFSHHELKPLAAASSRIASGLTNCVLYSDHRSVGVLDANILCSAFTSSLK